MRVETGTVTPVVHPTTATVAPSRRLVGSVAVTTLGLGLIAGVVDPAGGPTLCPFRIVTGYDCPLCGSTRAVHAFATGHPLQALDHNLLVGLAIPVLLLALLLAVFAELGGRPMRVPVLPRAAWLGVGILVLAFWVLRNLPAGAWLGSG